MFGDEIEIHAGLIGAFHDFEMIFIQLDVGQRGSIVLLHVIEESELHDCLPLLWRGHFFL